MNKMIMDKMTINFDVFSPFMEDIGGSTTRGCGDCCDGGSDVESGVTPIKTRLLRKGQSSGSDTMLEIMNDCIVFLE